jgi:glycosyltransferase involved in cell wall biosynthesis
MELRFSVLVPVFEQWNLVPQLVACLAAQTFPRDRFEIILADNGSSDFAPPPLLPANARIVACPHPGSYAARNAAAAEASGEWFVFTDADCLPDPEWLKALDAAAVESGELSILVGAVDVRPLNDVPNAYEIYDSIIGIPQERYAGRGYGATANLTTASRMFRRLGGFDSTRLSGGDAEFCRRAVGQGARTVFVPGARVGHPARNSWTMLATKSRRILGGQIATGPLRRRAAFLLRALSPPAIAWWRLLHAKRPIGHRAIAMLIQTRLWSLEVREAARLLAGRPAERR